MSFDAAYKLDLAAKVIRGDIPIDSVDRDGLADDLLALILRPPEPIEAAPGYEVVRSSPNGTALWIRVRGVGILRFNRARLNPDAQNAPEEPIGAAKYDADGVPVGLTSVQALAWALKLRPDPVAEPIEAVPSAPVADAAGLARAAFVEGWAAGHAGCGDGLPCRCDRNAEWDVSEIHRHLEEISYTPPPEEGT